MGKSLINGGFFGEKIAKSEDVPGRQVMTITDNLCLWLAGLHFDPCHSMVVEMIPENITTPKDMKKTWGRAEPPLTEDENQLKTNPKSIHPGTTWIKSWPFCKGKHQTHLVLTEPNMVPVWYIRRAPPKIPTASNDMVLGKNLQFYHSLLGCGRELFLSILCVFMVVHFLICFLSYLPSGYLT